MHAGHAGPIKASNTRIVYRKQTTPTVHVAKFKRHRLPNVDHAHGPRNVFCFCCCFLLFFSKIRLDKRIRALPPIKHGLSIGASLTIKHGVRQLQN